MSEATNNQVARLDEESISERFDVISDPIRIVGMGGWQLDLLTNRYRWSEELFGIYELDPTQIVASEEVLRSLIHPEDANLFQALLDQARSGSVASADIRVITASDQVKTVHMRAKAFFDQAGSPLRLAGTVEDITTRYAAEQALRNSEQRYRELMDSIPEPLVVYDIEGKAIYLNPAFERVFGWKAQELIGKRIDFVPEESLSETLEAIRLIFSTRHSHSFESRRRTKNGEVLDVTISATARRDHEGETEGMLVVLRDITAEKRMQLHLLDMQRAIVAELSTPLMPISDEVLVMPLIGAIDSSRAQQITERLLEGVSGRRARVVILDITGVNVVDTQVANAILQTAQAVRLLGAEVIITGIGPEIAQILVGLGMDLGNIVTRSTLQSGISYAARYIKR